MNKSILTAISLGIALTGLSALASASEKTEAEKAFLEADIINDGNIDSGEFDVYHQKIFTKLDLNKDRAVTLDECAGNCFVPAPGSIEAANSGTLHYRFEEIDADGGGQLEQYEYILYGRERFPQFDVDNNGLLNKEEFCTFYRESMPCTFTAAAEKLGE